MKIETIKVIEKTISVQSTVWSSEDIYKLLKEIEKEQGFKGFTKLHFEVGEFPSITYFVNYQKANENTNTKS